MLRYFVSQEGSVLRTDISKNTELSLTAPVRKTHTKLHPRPEWHIFHIRTDNDIEDFTLIYTMENGKRDLTLLNNEISTLQLGDMNSIFARGFLLL